MQASESGLGNNGNVDESINFRPSPNFKHMKKYLKSKFEEDQNEMNKQAPIQPPLPPNSPPPDSPITLKQEVEDDGYEPASSGDYSPGAADGQQAEGPQAEGPQAEGPPGDARPGADADLEPAPNSFIMCKDWVRGTCTRGASCIYVHKHEKSQLKGVYRFCRDFENGRCERQVCYFAHATTFEKEHFYRTAYLPPHALAHLKNTQAQQAPPVQPPVVAPVPALEVAVQSELPPIFANPPPPALVSGAVPLGAGAGAGGGGAPDAGAGVHFKRGWRDRDDFGGAPRDPARADPLARKCKRCDITAIRLQHCKAQVADAMRASQQLDEQLEQIIKKSDRLQAVLKTLLKPRRVREHMNNNLLGNRLSALGERGDGDKDMLLSQMKVLLAKILLGSEPDGRENDRDLAS